MVKKEKAAFVILRAGLGVVFLLFGTGKFMNDVWAQTIRTMDFFTRMPWNVTYSIWVIGAMEILTGISLILGYFVRFFAILAALQLAGILVLLSFQETRDIGLLGAAIYIAIMNKGACHE